jgi:hypothetical protein
MNGSNNIFDSNLISGSVKNQVDLERAFVEHSSFAKEYVVVALYRKDVRKWYEDNWPRVKSLLDEDFLDRFKMEAEHESRTWEFHLAVVMLDAGLVLVEKTWETGPDFCIKLSDNKKLWIEAVACDLGKVDPVEPYPNMIPGVTYSFGGNIEDSHRPRALRITSAIGSKFEKIKGYLDNPRQSGVSQSDVIIIAVNGHAIQHHSDASMLFKRAIFGQGPQVLVRREGKKEVEGGFYKSILTITKNKGDGIENIPANFMEMVEFSKISAVLYCGHGISHAWYNDYKQGDDFLFAYHVNPDNPVPDGLFKFGRGIRKDVVTGSITDSLQQ